MTLGEGGDDVDVYIEQVFEAVRAIREARGEMVDKGLRVSEAEFAAYSLATMLHVSGGFALVHVKGGLHPFIDEPEA